MNPRTQQDYQNLYRQYRQSLDVKRPQNQLAEKKQESGDLKNFYLKATVNKDSVDAEVTDATKLAIKFKVDCLVDSYVRVNACVTERKNANNVPEMFFTPHKEGFVQEKRLPAGNGQAVSVEFDLNYIAGYELKQNSGGYYPLIISINY